MINSRNLEDLHPRVKAMAELMIERCKAAGIDFQITSTYRDKESQDELYAQGRTKPGQKVTNARGGQSMHNYRVAFDVVPKKSGQLVWGTTGEDGKLWQKIGEIGESCGLEWAGRWKTFREMPHFQFTGGLSLADFQHGKKLT
jgi:peptidoglycan L-alanyl-D-glutamate endopeptidase CwlK